MMMYFPKQLNLVQIFSTEQVSMNGKKLWKFIGTISFESRNPPFFSNDSEVLMKGFIQTLHPKLKSSWITFSLLVVDAKQAAFHINHVNYFCLFGDFFHVLAFSEHCCGSKRKPNRASQLEFVDINPRLNELCVTSLIFVHTSRRNSGRNIINKV